MCKCYEKPIPVQVWTLDGSCYLGEGKIMGTAASHHALLNGYMLTPVQWGEDFDPAARACLAHAGASFVTVLDDDVIVINGCPLFASQVTCKEA